MTINIGVARGGPANGRILVHVGREKPGYELRETGRYVFVRSNWQWKEHDVGSMKDLLGERPYATAYPTRPGYKERTTSKDAADAVESGSSILRERAFNALCIAGEDGLTADEVASRLDESVLAIRPRITELSKANPPRIVPTGARRKNESNLMAKVWKAV